MLYTPTILIFNYLFSKMKFEGNRIESVANLRLSVLKATQKIFQLLQCVTEFRFLEHFLY